MLSGKKMREALKEVDSIIIDEVHEVISSKRGAQLSIGIERLKRLITKEKPQASIQVIGLSATVNNKKEVAEWLSKGTEIVNIEGNKQYEISILQPKTTEEDKELATKLHTSPSIASSLKIITDLTKQNKSIIFVNTRELAENISSRLQLMNVKNIGIHHSSLSKDSRINAEDAFKNGTLRGIIATSSLELGIDIGDIDLVIQYNSPRQASKLIQRVGRAGHTSTQVSKGKIITTNPQDYLESKAILKKAGEKWVEESPVYYKPLDVLAHQIIGFCLDEFKPKINDIYETIKKSKSYETLDWNEFMNVIELVNNIKLAFMNNDGTLSLSKKGRFYYYENLSMIPDEKNYHVINIDSNSKIGTLHEGFIARYGSTGNIFICRAQPWEILSIEGDRINVSPSTDYDSAIPSWEGELLPVHKEVAESVKELSRRERKMEIYGSTIILTTYLGSKINQTLSEILAYMISMKKETSIGIKSDAYRILFTFKNANDATMIENLLRDIKPSWIMPAAYDAVKTTNAFLYRFMHVAKRFGIIRKDAEFSNYRLKKLLDAYDNTPITKEAYKEMLVEKLDIEGAEKAITLINNGQLKLQQASEETISELATGFKDFSNPKTTQEIMDVVKERLLNTQYIYHCLNCGKHVGKLMVRDSKGIKCPCGSKLITFIKKTHENTIKILRKKLNNEALTSEESKEYKNLEQRANMFLTYDYMVPYAMSGRGIGITTAQRILKGYYKTEEDFLKKIIEAEKNFIKNKKYWK